MLYPLSYEGGSSRVAARDSGDVRLPPAADVVIVGGGSAGCVLASRLSEDPHRSVVLLEAGPDWRSADAAAEVRSLNPGLIIGQDKFDVLQYPALQARRTRLQEPELFWRGRGMGGSSTINGILAIRPVPEDHDEWGLPGWRWDDLLPALPPARDGVRLRWRCVARRRRADAHLPDPSGAMGCGRPRAERRGARGWLRLVRRSQRCRRVRACRRTRSMVIPCVNSASRRTTRTSSRFGTVRTSASSATPSSIG